MKLAILAAGLGSRFGGVKQLAPIGPAGETLLEYNIYNALEAGFDSIVFLIRKDIEKDFSDHILSRLPGNLPFELAFQSLGAAMPGSLEPALRASLDQAGRTRPWGTGHALLCARPFLEDGLFAVMNADDFYGKSGLAAVHDFLAAEEGVDRKAVGSARFCLPGYRLGNVVPPLGSVSRAICSTDASGRLERIVEHTRIEMQEGRIWSIAPDGSAETLSPDLPASMNLWGLTPAVFPGAEAQFSEFLSDPTHWAKSEFYLPALVGRMIEAGTARAWTLPVDEEYFGLTNPEDILGARQAIAERTRRGEYPSPLWSGKSDAGRR